MLSQVWPCTLLKTRHLLISLFDCHSPRHAASITCKQSIAHPSSCLAQTQQAWIHPQLPSKLLKRLCSSHMLLLDVPGSVADTSFHACRANSWYPHVGKQPTKHCEYETTIIYFVQGWKLPMSKVLLHTANVVNMAQYTTNSDAFKCVKKGRCGAPNKAWWLKVDCVYMTKLSMLAKCSSIATR